MDESGGGNCECTQCGKKVNITELIKHEDEECEFRMLLCQYCYKEFPSNILVIFWKLKSERSY